jgi:hypothetical protein
MLNASRPPAPAPPAPAPPCIRATKSWFFFDACALALGAGLGRSGACSGFPATTAIQQSNLRGDITVGTLGGGARVLAPNSTTALGLSGGAAAATTAYAWHGGIAYAALPEAPGAGVGPSELVVSSRLRSGTEAAVTQGDNATITLPVFSALLTHPPAAAGWQGQYAYAVVPVGSALATPAALAAVAAAVTVVSNTPALQVVCQRGGGESAGAPGAVLQAILTGGGEGGGTAGQGQVAAAAAGCWDVQVANALPSCRGWSCSGAIVQVRRTSGGVVSVSVAVPTRTYAQQPRVTVALSGVLLAGPACSQSQNGTIVEVEMNRSRTQSGASNSVACSWVR